MLALSIADLQGYRLADPQTAAVHQGKARPVHGVADTAQKRPDLAVG
jgi:hypothetical protein